MAWDKDRPVAPFGVYGKKTFAYADGKREDMIPFTYHKLDRKEFVKALEAAIN